jgi:hypothetical protein
MAQAGESYSDSRSGQTINCLILKVATPILTRMSMRFGLPGRAESRKELACLVS